jgi:hypothetical protein
LAEAGARWREEQHVAITRAPRPSGLLTPTVLRRAGAAVAIAVAVAIPKITGPRDLVVRATIVAAAVFYLSPAQFPWYALWFLGLAAAVPSFPLLAASATLAAYYTFGPAFQYGTAFLHSLPVFIWLAYTGIQRRAAASRPDTDPPLSVRAEAP